MVHNFFRLANFNNGSYTGDGVTSGRFILTDGCKPLIVLINRDNVDELFLSFTKTNAIKLSGTLSLSEIIVINSIHIENNNDGFVVGDGNNEANENGILYNFISIG